MRMFAVAISSAIHFFFRFVFAYCLVVFDKDLRKCMIPLFDKSSREDLGHILQIGYQSFVMKVMGWWAFDVFTQMAAL